MRPKFRVAVMPEGRRKNDENRPHPGFGYRCKHSPLENQSSRVSSWCNRARVAATWPEDATSTE
jgi:hypothetical protein